MTQLSRTRLALVVLVSAALCSGAIVAASRVDAVAVPAASAALAEKPNILLITTDDQALGDLAHMPQTRELLGGAGVTFSDAVVPFPLCCPARAMILTGELPHNNGVRSNIPPYGGVHALDPLADKTLPVWLKQAGYSTGFIGKYLNGYGLGEPVPAVPPGWDEWHASIAGTYDYFNDVLQENGTRVAHPGEYQTDLFGEITNTLVTNWFHANQPFFLWESDVAPHAAFDTQTGKWEAPMVPERHVDALPDLVYDAEQSPAYNERVNKDKTAFMQALPRLKPGAIENQRYFNKRRVQSLLSVDESVAKTVGVLRELGELDNTLIIFTSDNGFLLGQYRYKGKVLAYEPSLKVPLLMRGPGVPAGVVRNQSVALVDLAATIAEAAGATPLLVQDGRSLLGIAADPAVAGYSSLAIEAVSNRVADGAGWFYQGVRTRRFTYTAYPTTKEFELYDRRKDPYELTNVAYRPAYAETRADLAVQLEALRDCVGAECRQNFPRVADPLPEPYLYNGRTVHPDDLGSIGGSGQVVTVTAPDWQSGRGWLTAWQRSGLAWNVKFGPMRVVLGERGFIPGAVRRHHTGETPAGTFTVARTFGSLSDPGTAFAYRRIDGDDYWVNDRRDPATYNLLQPHRMRGNTWRLWTADRLWAHRYRYSHALVLGYNLPSRLRYSTRHNEWVADSPADVRRGAVFVHTGARLPAKGYASIPAWRMPELLAWLNPAQRPRFVMGPTDYLRSDL